MHRATLIFQIIFLDLVGYEYVALAINYDLFLPSAIAIVVTFALLIRLYFLVCIVPVESRNYFRELFVT